MANKDFKVKNKLQVAGITSAGPLISDSSGNLDSTSLIPTQYGGTGTSTSPTSGQILYSASGTNYAPVTLAGLPGTYAVGNNASRPGSPSLGQIYSNTQTGYIEVYTSGGWSQLGVIPLAAGIGTATDVGTSRAFNNAAVSVTFTPNSGGGLASSFTVASTTGGYSASGSSSPIVVTGIPSNTSLTFTVTATNGYGNSLASTASNSATATSVPQAPTIGTATNTTGTAHGTNAIAGLTFTAGATGGKTITNYKWSTDGTTYNTFSPAQTTSPLSISGLTSGQSYTFRLIALNANGDSLASSASNSITSSTVPANPTLGTPTVTNSTTVSIPFTAGATGNSNITGYTITSSPSVSLSYSTSQTSSPISVSGTFVQGTSYTFNVRANNANGLSTGVNSSSVTPFPVAVVSGGTLSSDATFYYRTFTSTGNLTVSNSALSADYLVIAGGGSGGQGIFNAYTTVFQSRGSGGGAGGVISGSATLGVGTHTATVGAGASPGMNAVGSNSSFNSLSAVRGGGGGSGTSGGSGGGVQGYTGTFGGVYGTAGGAGTSGQGNRGGNINNDHQASTTGGGGAGAAGVDSTTNGSITLGGVGSSAFSSWGAATSTGQNVSGTRFYGGGGSAQGLAGTNGGGGAGGQSGQFGGTGLGTAGTSNTGGGGGGGGLPASTGGVQFTSNAGGGGGSGLVIVRYTRAQVGG